MQKYMLFSLLICLTLMSVSLLAQQVQNRPAPVRTQIEIINIETGEITVVKKFDFRVEAPEWTPDGKWLYFNSGGFIYKMSPEGGEHYKVPTGSLNKNINDHVISPDGKWLATTDGGTGMTGYHPRIYVVPIDGGEPRLVTRNGNSALHGWSPDGKLLTFTGRRGDENRDIYTITLDGETETRLTTHPCWEDGSEFTPCGKYIWYNSSQSGLMQLWRMKADGSEKTHMLKEEANCWFPHPSRDGKWISYLAYKKGDVPPELHPPFKDVSIRLLPAEGGESKLLVEFFGGQGSFNVNSWAPDSKRLAYVRFDRPQPPIPAAVTGQAAGIFPHFGDVGDIKGLNGNVQFDTATKTYTLKGSGANIWGPKDAFFFVYMPVDGNFEMSAYQTLMNEGTNAHRKAGIMFRETLDADSPCILVTVHGDGLTSLQCREEKKGQMIGNNYDPKDPSPKFISLERNGDKFIVKIGKNNVDPTTAKEHEFKIGKAGYIGIYVCSHTTNDYERATFKEVNFKKEKTDTL